MFYKAAITGQTQEQIGPALNGRVSLLKNKLSIPPLPPDTVHRNRLIERLEADHNSRLLLISAPAGFGKTTLISEWLSGMGTGQAGIQTAWLSLEKADNNLGRFWKYAIAALQTLDPVIGMRLNELMTRPVLPPVDSWLADLVDDLNLAGFPLALVLDDYHVIQTRAIHKSVNTLLMHMPANARLVLITRADPSLPLARLRVQDQLVELRAADLLFTRSEIENYLNNISGLALSSQEIDLLAARTEGWPAGIHLAARSLQGCDVIGRQDFLRSFNGSNRSVFTYLLEEVLHQQPPEIREFLSRTSVLQQVSAPLAAALTGLPTGEAEQLLARLAGDNLFIRSLDAHGEWFRYHSLFTEALETALRREDPTLWNEIHRLAAKWCATNGHVEWAIDHALTAHDFTTAAGLIEAIGDATWSTGDISLPLHWLERLPESVLNERPALRLLQVWILVLHNRWTEAVALWEKTGPLVTAPGIEPILRGRWAAMGGAICGYRRLPEEAIRLSDLALVDLPEGEALWRVVSRLNIGLAHQALGNAKPAAETYRQMMDLCVSRGFLYPAITAAAHLIEVCHAQGRLYEVQTLSERLRDMEHLPGGGDFCLRAGGAICLGGLQYERNELDTADQTLSQAMAQLCPGTQSRLAIAGLVTQAHIAHARGDSTSARERLAKALELAVYLRPVAEDRAIRAQMALLALREKRWEEVKCWQATAGLDANALPDPRYELEYRVLAEILIAEGNYWEAEALLARLRAAAERGGRAGSNITLSFLYGVALGRQKRWPEAEAAVRRVLPLAQSQGYIRSVVDLGPGLLEMLNRPGIGQHAPAYVDRLCRTIEAEAGAIASNGSTRHYSPTPDDAARMIDHLTPREWEILDMIARGASNQEIADRLVLSVGTVKGHVNHIFSKLDVHNRTAAVARARDFQLLGS